MISVPLISGANGRDNMIKRRYLIGVILFLVLGLVGCSDANQTPSFPKTYKEFALPDNELPKMINSHPRLFIRQKKWESGPSVEELREWAKIEPLKSYLKQRPWDPKPGIEWAFRYLITGNEKLVPPIINKIKKQKGYWPGYLTTMAIEYDWIFNSPSFKDEDKKLIEEKMVKWAREAVKYGQKYHDMWSHYGYPPVSDLVASGLALWGRRPEAREFIAMAGGYMKKAFFRGWSLNDGAWQGGWTYYDDGPVWLFKMIAMWCSATQENLFKDEQISYWLRKHLYFLLATVYPDNAPFESTGISFAAYRPQVLMSLLILTRSLQDRNGIMWLKPKLSKVPWWASVWQFMYLTPEMRKTRSDQYTLPLSQIWGKNGLGYVQMRSGWGKNDTIIELKCGDYFWSHQFQNQNSFYIYRKGRLAIQSGIYDAYWGNHMQFYYRPTISSNSMLIIQPGEKTWIPPGVAKKYSIPNDNGFIQEWGGQRSCYMIPKFGSAETCFSFEKYLYRKTHQHHFETGDIKAYEVTDRYTYVYGDATAAYNNPNFSYPGNTPKLKLFTRELVFLCKKYLVVFDRVESMRASYEKRWLLHTIGEPEFSTKPVELQYPGHIEIYPAGLIRINNKGGTLFCQTIFPENYLVRKVGGGATVTECKTDENNKGNASLKVKVEGKYNRLSSTIATDKAQVEDWVIEFIKDNEFKIVGSKTGNDGVGTLSRKRKGVFISRSGSLFIPEKNWKGSPKKGDKFYFSVTSPSFRFWVNGKNYAPKIRKMYTIFKNGSHVDPGNWRIEVFPKQPKQYDTFLHFLYPCDRQTTTPPRAEGIKSDNGNLIGASVEDWVVIFPVKTGAWGSFKFPIDRSGVNHVLVLGAEKSKQCQFDIAMARGTETRKITASKEGTIFFDVTGPCEIEGMRSE